MSVSAPLLPLSLSFPFPFPLLPLPFFETQYRNRSGIALEVVDAEDKLDIETKPVVGHTSHSVCRDQRPDQVNENQKKKKTKKSKDESACNCACPFVRIFVSASIIYLNRPAEGEVEETEMGCTSNVSGFAPRCNFTCFARWAERNGEQSKARRNS